MRLKTGPDGSDGSGGEREIERRERVSNVHLFS